MYTIIDYLIFYKDISINEVHWNIMDNLMCSILVYLPIDSFNNYKTITELYNYSNNYKLNEKSSLMVPVAYQVLELVKDSKRYKNLKTSNFINNKNDLVQFGASTFRINNKTIISYKGTDGSLIGWIENIRIGYQYPTYTHRLAIDYINKNIKINDTNVYVVGHSKGGNLAMVSAMELSNYKFNKIKEVDNFDGPGFRYKEFDSLKYKRLSKKLVNIVPTESVVGVLLNNQNYNVVKSNKYAFYEHYSSSWNIFGEHFINGYLSNISKGIHESTTKGIKNLNNEDLEEYFETIFNNLEKDYSSDFKLTFEDLIKIYKNMKKVDSDISKYIEIMLNSMIKSIYDKND